MKNFILLLLTLLLKEETNDMAVIYVALIIKGKKTFAQVPDRLKGQVRQLLIDLELEELIEEE